MTLNWPLAIVAVLTAATLFLHIFGGGPEYLDIIRASSLPIEQTSMYAVLWHAVTVNLLLAACAYGLASFDPRWRSAAVLINFEFAVFGILFIWYGSTDLGTVWPMPQWILFLTFAGIATFGLRRSVSS